MDTHRTTHPAHPRITTAVVILNPRSGRTARMRSRREHPTDLVRRVADRHQLDISIRETTHRGHASDLAAAAVREGCELVVAWGGDGTINEIANAIASTPTALAVVPSGSGNGLARELGVPWAAERALEAALTGTPVAIDVGRINDRLFVNVAGIGFDAAVAQAFNAARTQGRGLPRYVALALREVRRYVPQHYRVAVGEDAARDVRAYVIALANSAQYGNGARIAPDARLDDGHLDAVIVEVAPVWRLFLESRRLFTGRVADVDAVSTFQMREMRIVSDRPMPMHADGEPLAPSTVAEVSVLPRALRVIAPRMLADASTGATQSSHAALGSDLRGTCLSEDDNAEAPVRGTSRRPQGHPARDSSARGDVSRLASGG